MGDYWSYKYLIDEKYEEDMYDTVSAKWRKTNSAISNLKISKEEKKMRKKTKIEGHVAHVLYDKHGHSSEYLYTVNPEKHEVVAWQPIYTFGEPDALPKYERYEWVWIIPNMLGRHGYLQETICKLQAAVFGSDYRVRDILAKIAADLYDTKKNLKEEKKMGETVKDRITLNASEDCYLEVFSKSNTITFHFGTESRVITVPDNYEIDWGIKEIGTCDLHIKKKKPSLLNGTLHFDACVERQGRRYSYTRYPGDLNSIIDVINGRVSKKEVPYRYSNSEILTKTYYHASDLLDDFRKLYNDRIIFPNASSLGITFAPDRE